MEHATFLLVHGSWQGSWSWEQVRELLHAQGYRTIAPQLPGHAPGEDSRDVTFADYEACVLDALDRDASGRVVLVGHSFGGAIISRIAELRPERCESLIYYAGFVPLDGESVADILPVEFVERFKQLSVLRSDRGVALPYDMLRAGFLNTADDATAQRLFPWFTPEPYTPVFESLPLPHNQRHGIRTTFIKCRDDRTMPPGLFHPGQSSRLQNPKVIEIDGDHEVLLTNPPRLAEALVAAVSPASVGLST